MEELSDGSHASGTVQLESTTMPSFSLEAQVDYINPGTYGNFIFYSLALLQFIMLAFMQLSFTGWIKTSVIGRKKKALIVLQYLFLLGSFLVASGCFS